MSDIADKNLHIKELKEYFEEGEPFRTNDLTEFYRKYDSELKKSTVNWRVYKLVQEEILERIGRGTFVLGGAQNYQLEIPLQLKKLYNRVQKEFPYAKHAVWNTSVLNEFMVHQPFRFFSLLEIEKEVTESAFHFLKSDNVPVFLEPDEELLQNYLPENKTPVIILPLVSEAPLQTVNGVQTATLEKILVDLFCDTTTFYAYQGAELSTIFKEAFERYTVHQNKLLRYARRRGKKDKLLQFLKSNKLAAVKAV